MVHRRHRAPCNVQWPMVTARYRAHGRGYRALQGVWLPVVIRRLVVSCLWWMTWRHPIGFWQMHMLHNVSICSICLVSQNRRTDRYCQESAMDHGWMKTRHWTQRRFEARGYPIRVAGHTVKALFSRIPTERLVESAELVLRVFAGVWGNESLRRLLSPFTSVSRVHCSESRSSRVVLRMILLEVISSWPLGVRNRHFLDGRLFYRGRYSESGAFCWTD